jgi:antitoxin Phd
MKTHTVTATELKNHLGAYLDAALTAPVVIQKSGRNVAVLISQQHYAHLQALEDVVWALRAQLAEESGYLGADMTQHIVHEMLHEDNSVEIGHRS